MVIRNEWRSSCLAVLLAACLGAWLSAFTQTLQGDPAETLRRQLAEQARLAGQGINLPAPAPVARKEEAGPDPSPKAARSVAQGYLYLEPYHARFEAMFDMHRMLQWLSPGQPEPESLSADQQKKLTDQAAALAQQWCLMTAGGVRMAGRLVGVSVVKGDPGRTLPLEEGEAVATAQSMLGFIWEFAIPPAPESLEIEWKGFVQEIDRLPIRAFFGSLSENLEVTAPLPKVRWKNNHRLPRPGALAAVPVIDAPAPVPVPVAGIVWLLAGLAFYIWMKLKDYRLPGGSLPYLGAWLLGTVLMLPLLVVRVPLPFGGGIPEIKETADAERIVAPLLRNVYRAFDHRDESSIYDVLERSVHGGLLRTLYLETIQALTLDGREGTRVTISEFDAQVQIVDPGPKGTGAFVAACQWTALGTVGHWGHTHQRINRYTAKVTIAPVQREWKITALEVVEARRL